MSARDESLHLALDHSANSPRRILNEVLNIPIKDGRCTAWWRGSRDLNISVGHHALTDYVSGESYGVWRLLTERENWSDEEALNVLFARAGMAEGYSPRSISTRQARRQHEKLETKQAKKASASLRAFERLSSSGTSSYLEDKGVSAVAAACKALRFDGRGGVAIVMSRITEHSTLDPVSVQWISFSGEKLFAKGGSVRGAVALIGTLDLDAALATGHIWLAEGVATALTIYAATGKPVLVTFTAGNLTPVAKALRALKSSSKLHISIAADNDQYHDTDVGNPGLESAHAAALRYHGKVVAPTFVDTSNNPTDFNDLHWIEGIGDVRQQLEQLTNPDPALAFATHRRRLVRRLKRTQAGRGRYLKQFDLQPGVTLLKAPHGTGKTEQLKQHIEATLARGSRVLYVTPSAALTDSSARRLSLESYADALHRDHLHRVPGVAICLNSLPRLFDGADNLTTYDLVILDESEQLTRALKGSHIANRERVLETLLLLLQRARHVICLDADLGRLTRTLLEQARPRERFTWLEHHHPVGEGRTMRLHASRDDLYAAASCCKNPALIVTNSKREAEALGVYLNGCGKRVRVLTGEHNEDDPTFLSDIDKNAAAETLEVVICSPTVRTGISLTAGYFKHVFGVFHSMVGTPEDALQALWRVRTPATYDVWLDRRMSREHIDLTARYGVTREHEAALLGRRVGIEHPTYRIIKQAVESDEQVAQAAYRLHFLKKAALQGFTFEVPDSDPTNRGLARSARDSAEGQRHERILAARLLTTGEAQALECRSLLRRDDRDALDRYNITSFYRPENLHELKAFLELDHRGRYRRQLERLELALAPDKNLNAQIDELLERRNLTDDFPLLASQREFYSEVLRAVRFDEAAEQVLARCDEQLTLPRYDLARLKTLLHWIERARKGLGGLVALPDHDTLRKNPLRYVGRWLKMIGLKQRRVGDNGARTYALELEALKTACNTMQKRQTLFLKRTLQEKSVCDRPSAPPAPATWVGELLMQGKLEEFGAQKLAKIKQQLATGATGWLNQLATSTDLGRVLGVL